VAIDTKQSAIAPRSRIVRYAIKDAADRRIFSMLFPQSAGVPEKGEEFEVLYLPNRASRAIAAELYAE
jgi:hypothetical protein